VDQVGKKGHAARHDEDQRLDDGGEPEDAQGDEDGLHPLLGALDAVVKEAVGMPVI